MFNRTVKHRGIIHERIEDAPFTGALIIAANCSNNCVGCYNQHLKESPVYQHTAEELIKMVLANPFNDGIILGGLEWSEQFADTVSLIEIAQQNNLRVMLYTGLTRQKLFRRISRLFLTDCYIKYGDYREAQALPGYKQHGVTLASNNQKIEYIE